MEAPTVNSSLMIRAVLVAALFGGMMFWDILSAWGLWLALAGAILLAITSKGMTKTKDGGYQGDVSWVGLRLRRMGVTYGTEVFVDWLGRSLAWTLIVIGVVIQIVAALS